MLAMLVALSLVLESVILEPLKLSEAFYAFSPELRLVHFGRLSDLLSNHRAGG